MHQAVNVYLFGPHVRIYAKRETVKGTLIVKILFGRQTHAEKPRRRKNLCARESRTWCARCSLCFPTVIALNFFFHCEVPVANEPRAEPTPLPVYPFFPSRSTFLFLYLPFPSAHVGRVYSRGWNWYLQIVEIKIASRFAFPLKIVHNNTRPSGETFAT